MRNSFPGAKNSTPLKTFRPLSSVFPSGPIIFPPILVTTFVAGSSPMFFEDEEEEPPLELRVKDDPRSPLSWEFPRRGCRSVVFPSVLSGSARGWRPPILPRRSLGSQLQLRSPCRLGQGRLYFVGQALAEAPLEDGTFLPIQEVHSDSVLGVPVPLTKLLNHSQSAWRN